MDKISIEQIIWKTKNNVENISISAPTEETKKWIHAVGNMVGPEQIGVLILEDSDFELEIYVVDQSLEEKYMRFIIDERYIMSASEEQMLNQYCFVQNICASETMRRNLFEKYNKKYPDTHLMNYENIFLLLNHLYYAIVRRGVKELLYKSGLHMIAMHYSDLETANINLIGDSPSEMFEMPINLLRALNTEYGVRLLKYPENREKLKTLYMKKPDFFKEKKLNKFQCIFFERSVETEHIQEFMQGMEYLESWTEEVHEEQDLWEYLDYLNNRELLKGIAYFPVILNENKEELIYKAGYISHFLFNNMEYADAYIRGIYFSYGADYEYKKGDYEIQFLKDGLSMVNASEILSNCLWNYIHEAKMGHFLFFVIKEKGKIVGAMRIRRNVRLQDQIREAKAAKNKKLSSELIQFVKEYAKVKELKANIYDLREDVTEEMFDENMEVIVDYDEDEEWI